MNGLYRTVTIVVFIMANPAYMNQNGVIVSWNTNNNTEYYQENILDKDLSPMQKNLVVSTGPKFKEVVLNKV